MEVKSTGKTIIARGRPGERERTLPVWGVFSLFFESAGVGGDGGYHISHTPRATDNMFVE